MQPTILAGTDDGIHVLGDQRGVELEGRAIRALAAGQRAIFAIADGTEIVASDGGGPWTGLATLPADEGRCLLPTPDGLLVGTAGAHLVRLVEDSLQALDGFESVAGRDGWYTPWGGPPATRSLSVGAAGELYANVHVGGIPRSDDGGASWRPTIDVDVDVHEVLSPVERPGLVLAACSYGLATSHDSGESWALSSDGLAATYSRAVALAGDVVVVSASDGPRGGHAALYRRLLHASGPFERCTVGLPEWFDDNVDTACVDAAAGSDVAFGTASGAVYLSRDAGETWGVAAEGLPPVKSVLLMPAP